MVRYKRVPLVVVVCVLTMLLFAQQGFASTPTLSSMLSEESWQQFQELTPDVQFVIRESLFPQVLEKVTPESQREALEAIVRVTYEQQSDPAEGDRGYNYGGHIMIGSSIGWTINMGGKHYLSVVFDVHGHGQCWRGQDYCESEDPDCYGVVGITYHPNGPGNWYYTGEHRGKHPAWYQYLFFEQDL